MDQKETKKQANLHTSKRTGYQTNKIRKTERKKGRKGRVRK